MASIRPILDKIVVQVEKSDKSSGGIILVENSKKKPMQAKVIARGPGGLIDGREVKMYVNEGDRVLIPSDVGVPFNMEGKEYLIVSQPDVLAIIA